MRIQSPQEEKWNTWSHSLGAVLGVVGLVVLLLADAGKTAWSTASILIYSLSMILLFSSSAIYHFVKGERQKFLWRKMDHISIYFLIAGSYTPIALVSLYRAPGLTIFAIVWSIVLIGTLLKVFFTGRFQLLSVLLYLIMGWLVVLYWGDVMARVPENGIYMMFIGGAFYTTGVIFYLLKKLRFQHVIWHFFVLAGAIAHFFMVLEVVR
ncbi:PAQR family membrane homeostasis protein TrhA [Robertkochia sediminum]|uniref:PAQR family membrane homeostasis protein TrhA n=1 Tax=Robertkochia sediminum TaxID=2785326 RepID=UPI001933DB0F|nr:hemolysin III family protein [Robertkochia sediminum]MBL7471726.1 hemolysin III family protein [Robertkochia sediminum]